MPQGGAAAFSFSPLLTPDLQFQRDQFTFVAASVVVRPHDRKFPAAHHELVVACHRQREASIDEIGHIKNALSVALLDRAD